MNDHLILTGIGHPHFGSSECPCNPTLGLVTEADGQIAWAYVHNKLPEPRYKFLAGVDGGFTTTITINNASISSGALKSIYGHDLKGIGDL